MSDRRTEYKAAGLGLLIGFAIGIFIGIPALIIKWIVENFF